jgi:hypothetical protein
MLCYENQRYLAKAGRSQLAMPSWSSTTCIHRRKGCHNRTSECCGMTEQRADFHLYRKGSLVEFRAISPAAKEWIEENVALKPWQHLGCALWVESEFASDLIDALSREAFTVELQPVT